MNEPEPLRKPEVRTFPPYQAIVILGRAIGQDRTGHWRATPYFVNGLPEKPASIQSGIYEQHVDPNNPNLQPHIAGSNANNLAGFHLYNALSQQGTPPDIVIFAAGKPPYLDKNDPTEGDVLEKRFLQKVKAANLPVPKIEILAHDQNTRDDMRESLKRLKELGLNYAAAITVGVHIPRSQEFLKLERNQTKIDDVDIDLIAAEEILSQVDRRYAERFRNIQTTEAYKNTKFYEDRGLKALKEGNY